MASTHSRRTAASTATISCGSNPRNRSFSRMRIRKMRKVNRFGFNPSRSSLSARRPSPLYSSAGHREARPKVALVVVQGIENRNVDSMASIPSRHIRAKTLRPGSVELTASSAESVQVIQQAFHATNYTTSLLAIEVGIIWFLLLFLKIRLLIWLVTFFNSLCFVNLL